MGKQCLTSPLQRSKFMKKTVYTYIFQEQKSELIDGKIESWVDTYQVKAEGVRQAYKKVPPSAMLIEVEDRSGYMELMEYQRTAMATAIYPKNGIAGLAYVALGLNGEAGEVAEIVKKIIRDEDVGVSREKLDKAIAAKLDVVSKEIGDVLWYVAAICSELGLSMDEVAAQNVDKLQSRKKRNLIKGSGSDR